MSSRSIAAFLSLVVGSTAMGHITVLSPNGGEELEVGSVFTISWQITIAHGQLNWDVYYSTASQNGPWTTIAEDLPPGSSDELSVHTYDWTVPDVVDDSVWVRVIMDNAGNDYNDVNNAPFAIVEPENCVGDVDGNGAVDVNDVLAAISAWGPCDSECPEDIDGNGSVDVNDILALISAWGPCP